MHAILCSGVYTLSFYLPYCQFYGVVFLLFEISTVFLNAMWYVKFVWKFPDSSPIYRIVAG